MKIHVRGKTPMERLANFTRGVLAVPKADVERAAQKQRAKKRRTRRAQSA